MHKDLYTIFEVAQLLGLHEKTVRGYVREGKLRSTRVGKRYRIVRADLEAFTGGALGGESSAPVETEVSCVVEVNGLNPEKAQKLCNLLLSSLKGRREDRLIKVETLYDEMKTRLKIIILGSLESTGILLGMIDHLSADAASL